MCVPAIFREYDRRFGFANRKSSTRAVKGKMRLKNIGIGRSERGSGRGRGRKKRKRKRKRKRKKEQMRLVPVRLTQR